MMSDKTRQEIMRELAELAFVKPLQPHEFTVRMFAEDNNKTYEQAKRAMRRLYEDGVVDRRKLDSGGLAFWMVKDD